ncbi:hypothetical protein [Burkholderia cenocepacia]|uniref:hypothetical protein n=1 Tax=Burkholderia cepacia complex TaxID=87882 RepID=UPI00196AD6A9|nr:hypothetical protein [Burkholderia cenocepacia]MBN3507189.1 hypothetical protein [Burkholderia cenocepacia]
MAEPTGVIDPASLSRDQKLTLIYRHTHRDYKGKADEVWGRVHVGKRTLLVNRKGVTVLALLEQLTEEEIAEKLPYALKKEADRLAAKEQQK